MTRSNLNLLLTRRLFLGGASAALALSGAPAAFAAAHSVKPLIVVILRGAMDGLGAVPHFDNAHIHDLRADLLPPQPGAAEGALALGDGFALHPALSHLHGLYQKGQAAILHASAMRGGTRSHFDEQDRIETGVAFGTDGWLNRAISAAPHSPKALGIGPSLPLILRGDAPAGNWAPDIMPEAPDQTLDRLMDLYAGDDLLAPALATARDLDERLGDAAMTMTGRGRSYNSAPLFAASAKLIRTGAADTAVIALPGWDTHAGQGAQKGQLSQRLSGLDKALASFKQTLGPELWGTSVVMVVTEFGRTARMNGTKGTDHGTGGAAFLLGGAVRGGRMLGDWPGLSAGALFENRDLAIATDIRALFKGVLRDHWGVSRADLDNTVFPGSADIAPLKGLLRS